MIVILGAGISGISLGYYLNKKSIPFVILDRANYIGGKLITKFIDGYSIELGANSFAVNDNIKEIFKHLHIEDKVISANNNLKKKFILKSNKLICLSLKNILLLKVLSFRGLTRALGGLFRKYDLINECSVADYFTYKFGREFLDYIISPAIKGIYAGDVNKLSFRSVFKKLYSIEKQDGLFKFLIKSIFNGSIRDLFKKREIISFEGGMSQFVYEMSKSFSDNIILNSYVKSVNKESSSEYKVEYYKGEQKKYITAKYLISTLPSYAASSVFKSIDKYLFEYLNKINYSFTGVIHLGYKDDFIINKRGWGFLNSTHPNKSMLGAIWNSYVFDGKSPSGYLLFCIYVNVNKNININYTINDFNSIMNINTKPEFVRVEKIKNAIPQKNLNYCKIRKYIKNIESKNKNLFFLGNYISGLSVSECINKSKHLVDTIILE